MAEKKKGFFKKAIEKLTDRDEKEELEMADARIKELEVKLTKAADKKKKADAKESREHIVKRREAILKRQAARQKPVVKKHVVVAGDTLTGLAKKYYGDDKMYMILYEANKDVIGDDPDMIKIGMELKVPEQ